MTLSRGEHLVITLAIVAFALWMFGGEWVQSKLAADWKTTEGVITESRIIMTHDDDGAVYSPSVLYRYSLPGELYFGTKVTLRKWVYANPSEAAVVIQRYPVGLHVTVHYNPDHPADSALEMSPRLFPLQMFVFSSFGLVAIVILLRWMRRDGAPQA